MLPSSPHTAACSGSARFPPNAVCKHCTAWHRSSTRAPCFSEHQDCLRVPGTRVGLPPSLPADLLEQWGSFGHLPTQSCWGGHRRRESFPVLSRYVQKGPKPWLEHGGQGRSWERGTAGLPLHQVVPADVLGLCPLPTAPSLRHLLEAAPAPSQQTSTAHISAIKLIQLN